MKNTKITWFARKPLPEGNYSVENVFKTVRPYIELKFSLKVYNVPFHTIGLWRRILNIFYGLYKSDGIVHIVGDIHYVSYFLSKKKTVITMLDCVLLHRSSGIKCFFYKLFWYKLPNYKSIHITTISQSVKMELIKKCGIAPDKISVIYCPLTIKSIKPKFEDNNKKFKLLQIGTTENKNISRLAKAIRNLDCTLTIIGRLYTSDRLELLRYSIKYVEKVGLSSAEIGLEYLNSDLVVFCSTYEGFGLPIIEAQAYGVPVVTSNISSMPEIAGDGAIVVDPFKVDEITKAIVSGLTDFDLRKLMIKNGFNNIKRFNPEKIANQYADLYKKLI